MSRTSRAIILALALQLSARGADSSTLHFAQAGREINLAYLERLIPGIQIWEVGACAASADRITQGEIIQRAKKVSVVLFGDTAVDAITGRAVSRSRSQRAADAAEGFTLAGAALTSGRIIHASASWTSALLFAAGAAHFLAGKLQRQAPDPSRLRQLLLPQEIRLAPGDCWVGLALGLDPH